MKNNEGKWVWVEPVRDSLIVNLGSIMQNMTNGELPATIHRVMDLGEDRYSGNVKLSFKAPTLAGVNIAKQLFINKFYSNERCKNEIKDN